MPLRCLRSRIRKKGKPFSDHDRSASRCVSWLRGSAYRRIYFLFFFFDSPFGPGKSDWLSPNQVLSGWIKRGKKTLTVPAEFFPRYFVASPLSDRMNVFSSFLFFSFFDIVPFRPSRQFCGAFRGHPSRRPMPSDSLHFRFTCGQTRRDIRVRGVRLPVHTPASYTDHTPYASVSGPLLFHQHGPRVYSITCIILRYVERWTRGGQLASSLI